MTPTEDLLMAARVLARLIREEYPPDRSLAEIARVWADATAEEAQALEALQSLLEITK